VTTVAAVAGEHRGPSPHHHRHGWTWPLSARSARLLFLRACCAVAEGAAVPPLHNVSDASSRCSAEACVAAVLGDPQRRVSVLGGREGMPRSLGSVFGGSVTRFLGSGLHGVTSRVIRTPGVKASVNGVAVSRDGATLLLSDWHGGSDAIHEFSVADGCPLRVVGKKGNGPLRFNGPCQVWLAADDFVFVADVRNHRIQVLTPRLDFHGFVGVRQLQHPVGVCADADVVVVSECEPFHRVSVFSRDTGALLRRFGRHGGGDGQLHYPNGLCFRSRTGHRVIAVVDSHNHRVSVFTVDGEFVGHVGVRVLVYPQGVACSAFDELVVADTGSACISVFSGTDELVATIALGICRAVTIRGCAMFVQSEDAKCVVLT
jgi:DNA-binding beta-propeller fold protein YncE